MTNAVHRAGRVPRGRRTRSPYDVSGRAGAALCARGRPPRVGPLPGRAGPGRARPRKGLAGGVWLAAGALLAGCWGEAAPDPRPGRPPGSWHPHRDEPGGEPSPRASSEAELAERIRTLEDLGYAAGYELAAGAEGVTFHVPERATPGLSLVVSGHAPEATLIDLEGRVVHRWEMAFEAAWPGREGGAEGRGSWRRAHVLEDGGLLAIFTALGVVRLDRASNLVWAWEGRAHHDLSVADDGTIHVLTRQARVLPQLHPSEPILEDFVTRLTPNGHALGRVSVYRSLLNSEHAAFLEGIEDHGDLFHSNTVQWLDGRVAERSPELAAAFPRGAVLVSVRQLDLLLTLDLERETVLWARQGPWHRQHEPTLLDGGTMLVFDNASVPERSGVLEFEPLSGAPRWVYRVDRDDAFYSATAGTCQRLESGHTLITESNEGRAFEVTPEGEIVWEWRSPHRAGEGGELVATLFDLHRLSEGSCGWLDRR